MKNIKVLFLLAFVRNFTLSSVIWNLFYYERGFTIRDLAIFALVSSVSQLIFELPSGVIADKWGFKKTLALSRITLFIGFLIKILSRNYIFILFSWSLEGFTSALVSDTDTSLIYDELKKRNKESKYKRVLAFYNGIGFLAFSLASLIGAVVADKYGYLFNYLLTLPMILISLFVVFVLDEPEMSARSKRMVQKPWIIIRTGIKEIAKKAILLKLIYFTAVIYAFNMIVWDYYQTYAMNINLPVIMFGLISVIFSVAESGPQFLTSLYKGNKTLTKIFAIIVFFAALLGVGASIFRNNLGFWFLIISVMITGFSFPITDSVYKRNLSSEFITTMCSFSTITSILTYSLMSVFFGSIAEKINIFTAFGAVSWFLLLSTIAFFFFERKKKIANLTK